MKHILKEINHYDHQNLKNPARDAVRSVITDSCCSAEKSG